MHINQKSEVKTRLRIIKRPSEFVENSSIWEIEILRGILWQRIMFGGGRLCFMNEKDCRSFIEEHKNIMSDYHSVGVERKDGDCTEIVDEIVVLDD